MALKSLRNDADTHYLIKPPVVWVVTGTDVVGVILIFEIKPPVVWVVTGTYSVGESQLISIKPPVVWVVTGTARRW